MYVVPVLVLFLILQRGFVAGISTSGPKQPCLPTRLLAKELPMTTTQGSGTPSAAVRS
jgi:hypothetical protein